MSLLNNSALANREGKSGNVLQNSTVRVVMKKETLPEHKEEKLKINHLRRNNNNLQDKSISGPTSNPFPGLSDKETSTTENIIVSSQRLGNFLRLPCLSVTGEKSLEDNESGIKTTHPHKRGHSDIRIVHNDADSSESTPQECGEILDEDSNCNDQTLEASSV